MFRRTELRQITQTQKIISTDKLKTQFFTIQTHVGQANRKPKAKQKHPKLKHFGSWLTAHFIKFSENFYFLLKGWACPSSISHSSSRISRLIKQKSCDIPIATPDHVPITQNRRNRNPRPTKPYVSVKRFKCTQAPDQVIVVTVTSTTP